MTPIKRVFRELLDLVARAYELETDALTTEDQYPPPAVREARQVVCLVAVEVIGLPQRQLAHLMQRDPRAISNGLKKVRATMAKSALLRRIVAQVTMRARVLIRDFDAFRAEAAE